MTKVDIETVLNKFITNEYWITVLGNNSFRLNIAGEVHVQQIKDILNISKWEYSGKNTLFYISGI